MFTRLHCYRPRGFILRKMTTENRLRHQLSPYLLQHKANPVDWYPWGEEALEEARRQQKMIFLSIGYSTCHWCHVMERESFENQAVADIMNEKFINVKVDREERPDVDKVYMTFVQATTGGGGWPLSLWLSPDLHPVFGGTYFPPSGNFGRPGFKQVLLALASQWGEPGRREEMVQSGRQVIQIIHTKMGAGSLSASAGLPGPGVFRKLHVKLSNSYDKEFGGYSAAPKFPQPSLLMAMFRLQSWREETADRKKRGLEMNLHTLDMMDLGGIHDHIMSGFARYSTDKKWHVPHFEKMLYDQAQLAMAYSAAYSLTKHEKYKRVVEDILLYVSRDLTHSQGGFFAAEDADSKPAASSQEKKEGAFCVWDWEEIQSLLSKQVEGEEEGLTLAKVVANEYNMKQDGNVDPRADPHGELKNKNVLTKIPENKPLMAEKKYKEALEEAKKILFQERLKRPRPGLDIKILTSWNALMISAYCKCGTALGNADYITTALKAANFVRNVLWNPETKRLLRSVYGGKDELENLETPIQGFVDDYVFTVGAFLDLYQATLDETWLSAAVDVQGTLDELFLDQTEGGYFTSKEGDPEIILRLKDDQDGAEPCSNSVAAMNLFRLGRILNNPGYTQEAEKILRLYDERLQQLPNALPAMVEAYLYHHQSEPLIVITGDLTDHPVLQYVQSCHLPSHTIVTPGHLLTPAHPLLSSLPAEKGAFLLERNKLSTFVRSGAELQELLQ